MVVGAVFLLDRRNYNMSVLCSSLYADSSGGVMKTCVTREKVGGGPHGRYEDLSY